MIRFLSQTVEDMISGTALLRLDFNTEDEWRMKAALSTIRFLLGRAEKLIIVSHRGRPRGLDKKLSLRKDAGILRRLLKRPVTFVPHLRFSEANKQIARAPKGSLFLLENLRFDKGEEHNTPAFAKQLASLADYFVNDAFAVSHRDDASVDAITHFLPSYAGLELEKELQSLSHVLERPRRPLVVVLGGSKAHDKLGVLSYFLRRADWILVGGGAANTLLTLRGVRVFRSLVDSDPSDLTKLRSVVRRKNIIVPVDCVFENQKMLDIGPKTIRLFKERIKRARTIILSGPLGLIEKKPFDRGTLAVVRAIAANTKAFKLAGGGETVMFLKNHRLDKTFTFISTGGGAMIDFLAGQKLPGIVALERRPLRLASSEARTSPKRPAVRSSPPFRMAKMNRYYD